MLLTDEGTEDKKNLNKLNILQGGIEARFIPSLSKDTKTQIEGSFKITGDKKLQTLAQQGEDKVILSLSDSLFGAIIDIEKSNEKVEITVNVLQQGLLTKRPACLIARLGGTWGMPLTRAAFAAMLKFSSDLTLFTKLMEDVEFTSKDIGDAEQGNEKAKSIAIQLRN